MKLPAMYDKLSYRARRRARDEYYIRQKGLCYHCGGKLTEASLDNRRVNKKRFPDGFFEHPEHLHHNHVTGLTVGVVHAYCNAVLWQYHGE